MERQVEVDNAAIHLIECGSGPSILFLHGNPDSGDLWIPVMDRLEPEFRCFAPDLPGFGRSKAPPNFDCSLQQMAAFVEGLVDAARIPLPLHVVVHDFGGPFGMAWAVTHREQVKSLCVMNSTFFSDFHWHFWARIWRTPLLGELSLATMNWPLFRHEMQRGSRKLTEEQMRHTYKNVTPALKRMVLRLYRATDPANFRGWEGQLLELISQIPTLVLWGDRDPYISPRYAERFGAARVVHYPECGHWVPLEESDSVAAELRAHVSHA
ncbi:MAG TPA: alpha/beta hydrolase [Acidobacteriota bacterium]|nr:alpha/beta hydrolase [Acidobacteriota bacterium]